MKTLGEQLQLLLPRRDTDEALREKLADAIARADDEDATPAARAVATTDAARLRRMIGSGGDS